MSLDTQNQRMSAINVSLPWRCMLPLPDGAIDSLDREQFLWLYRAFISRPKFPEAGLFGRSGPTGTFERLGATGVFERGEE